MNSNAIDLLRMLTGKRAIVYRQGWQFNLLCYFTVNVRKFNVYDLK